MPTVDVCTKEESGRVALTSLTLPDPGPGQVLVRTELTTICGSDIHLIDDFDEVPVGTPMGHEAVGVIEATGDGIERFAVGDRVVTSCFQSCGTCAPCARGDVQVCATHGAPFNILLGAQSQAYLMSGADLSMAHVPEGMDARHALLTSDIMSTGFAAIERASVSGGETVAVFAQGPVGLCATAAARHYGAERIFAVESIPERRAMALRLGATDVVDPDTAVDTILEATGGAGVDVAVEALGAQATIENCCRVTRFGGVISSVGVYASVQSITVPTDGTFLHRTFVTTLCPAGTRRLEYLLDLIEAGRVDLSPLLTHNMALGDVVGAYARFRDHADGVIKIALEP